MAVKRSLISWKRPYSLAYFEILLETLVVLIVVTELSLEWAAYSLPELREIRVNPAARGRVVKALLGIGQEPELWDQFFASSVSSDRYLNPAISRMGAVTLLCSTAILYFVFAGFVISNINWRPPTFSVPDQFTAEKWCAANLLAIMAISVLGIMAVLLLTCAPGWRLVPMSGPDNVIPLWTPMLAILLYVYRHADYKPAPVEALTEPNKVGEKQAKRVSKGVLGDLNFARRLLGFFLVIGSPAAALCLVPLTPMFPVLAWAGLVHCGFLVFGEGIASAGLVIVTCLLIVYSMARMLHLQLGGSWAEWILPKAIRLFEACTQNDMKYHPDDVTKLQLPHPEYFAQHPRKIITDILLDSLAICVIACVVVSAFPDGQIYPDGLHLAFFLLGAASAYEPIPQCISPMVVKFSYWANTNQFAKVNATDAFCKNHHISSADSQVGQAIHLTCQSLLGAAALLVFLVITAALCHMLYVIRQKCKGSVPETKIVADETQAWKEDVYDWHNALSLFPLHLVKIILPFYALDFFLPEKLHIPGLTVCLLAYGMCLCRKLTIQIAAYVKYRKYSPGGHYHGELDEPALLIA